MNANESTIWRCRDAPDGPHGYESIKPNAKWSNMAPCRWCGRFFLAHDEVSP